MGFDQAWAERCVDQLKAVGVEFAPGFDDVALDEISAAFGATVPLELRLFLSAGVPTSPKWARWVEGPDVVLGQAREWIGGAFEFDVRQKTYWHGLLGPRPAVMTPQSSASLSSSPRLHP